MNLCESHIKIHYVVIQWKTVKLILKKRGAGWRLVLWLRVLCYSFKAPRFDFQPWHGGQ